MRYILFFLIILYTCGINAASQDTSAETFRQLNLFSEIFRKIRTLYADVKDDQVLIEGAIKGMCAALDSHSHYLSKRAYQDLQAALDGALYGIGVELTLDQGKLKILSSIEDSPAHKVGLKTGDRILEIDGESTVGIVLDQAAGRLKGKPGDGVRLKIEREGAKPFEIIVVREKINIKPLSWQMLDSIPYVRISTFQNAQVATLLKETILEIQKQQGAKFQGMILDLRQNSGGLFDEAIAVANLFLDQKEIVEIRGRNKKKLKCFTSGNGDILKNKPLIVLVDQGTASSAEIVAGALKANNRAILVGSKTFGKGSVQTVFPLEFDQGAIRLTTGLYQLSNQEIIEGKGIVPNIIVPLSKHIKSMPIFAQKNTQPTKSILRLDAALEKAIKTLRDKMKKVAA